MPVRTTSPFSVYARNMKFRSSWEVTRIISFDIARYDNLYELLQLTGFPEELIMNRDVKSFKEYLHL